MAEYRPASGSCGLCQEALGLSSLQEEGVWYCSAACAEGRSAAPVEPEVPEPWLYHRPRRFLKARKPKELNSSR